MTQKLRNTSDHDRVNDVRKGHGRLTARRIRAPPSVYEDSPTTEANELAAMRAASPRKRKRSAKPGSNELADRLNIPLETETAMQEFNVLSTERQEDSAPAALAEAVHSGMPTALEWAQWYTLRGCRVIPVHFRSKRPRMSGWQHLRLTPELLAAYFPDEPTNIGLLTGAASGGIIDVDLDDPLAVELAPQFLPPTTAVFGRPGKPKSHYVYHVSGPIETRRYQRPNGETTVELRADGCQTVVPPSTHESGELISWAEPNPTPALVESSVLDAAVAALHKAVLSRYGELDDRSTTVIKQVRPSRSTPLNGEEFEACLAKLRAIKLVDKRDGSNRLFRCACILVAEGVSDADALSIIRTYETERPFLRTWSDAEILTRIRDAEKKCDRGSASGPNTFSLRLGDRDPVTGRVILSPIQTLPTAKSFVESHFSHADGPTLFYHSGGFVEWRENCYRPLEETSLRRQLMLFQDGALQFGKRGADGKHQLVDFNANPTAVTNAVNTLAPHVLLPAETQSPTWLVSDATLPPAREVVACKTHLLHLPTLSTMPSTPRFFVTAALPFDFAPDAPQPVRWLRHLNEVFDGDESQIDLLNEWFGYSLSGDTSLQKILLLLGPPRSGKGTIARVLTELVGHANVCSPTAASLARPFGLQQLLGRSLAIIGDARFRGPGVSTVTERLLTVSGEDRVTVDRKHRESLTVKLPTRFVFLSNELPRLNDSAAAIARRFIVCRGRRSFLGKEDPQLTDRLLTELPGILRWAVEGWQSLTANGRFAATAESNELVEEMARLASPVQAFVAEMAVVGPEHRVDVTVLFEAYERWRKREGFQFGVTRQTFGRDLAAAFPEVVWRRGTNDPFYQGIRLAFG